MRMMGYNDGGEYNKQDSFNGRKLRPLIPRPIPSPNNTLNSSSPSLSRLRGTEFFALNQHLDQSKREFDTQPVVVMSSRWNPTPEQLRTLEELYRRGTRTPSADQIQQITLQLRRYGKIEGKNVFYWFQNHKARERQKRRRQLESSPHELHRDDAYEVHERKDSGSSYRTGNFEGEETNNWGPSISCSTLTEESAPMQRAAKAAVAGCRPDGWIQFDEGELQHTRRFMERNATWQMMPLSCPPLTNLIISTNTSTATATTITSITTESPTTAAATRTTPEEATIRTMDAKLIKTRDLMDLFIASHIETGNNVVNIEDGSCGGGESQTLQLFPLRSNERESNKEKDINFSDIPIGGAMSNANLTSFQFYEFLPLKN